MFPRVYRAAAAALLVGATGCDLSVFNPGPVADELLDDAGAHAAVVTGAELNLIEALQMITFFGADAAKEFTQGGRIHPIKLPPNPGQLDRDEQLPDNAWERTQQARWIAEDAVRRLTETVASPQSSALVAEAMLYAGYSNRTLGENMCFAVIDGGPAEDRTVHLERAEDYFTQAISVANAAGASTVATAATAGRASVRLWLGDNAGAVADASAVPVDFEYQALFSAAPTDHNNWIYYISSNRPYRAHSVWGTYYEDYYLETGDPRVAWGTDPATPTAEFTNIPWYFQLKYTSAGDPVNLSSGREMVLIRAEVALRQGNWQQALALINSIRSGISSDDGGSIPLWTATNATEAWTALKRERGIELWFEGRRLGDLWRWVDEGTPGAMEDVSDRVRLCFPMGLSELQTNDNIPLDFDEPVNPLFEG